jgi:hypothetical protein
MSAASDRLASFYNGLAYNASTNAGGMASGGHRINFIPALQDVATVGGEVATNATAAASSASSASASATAAAASATSLQATSATSITIGTGSKVFTTQAGKLFSIGAWVNIRSGANPTANYMIGQVTGYTGTTLTVNVTVTAGSGTFADWTIDLSSSPGQTGATGNTGAIGPSPAVQFNFSTGVTDSDPGNGLFKFDSATFAAVTFIYFDNLNKDSVDVQNWLDSLDDSTNTTNRGRLYFMQPSASTKMAYFRVTGSVINGTGYRKVPVAPIICSSASIPFDAAASIAVDFSPSGDAGLNGSGAGDVVGPASATDSAIALYNTTTGKLLKDSGFGIGTSGANVGLLNGNNTYSGTSSFTGTVAWSSTLIGTVANANALVVGRQGLTNPAFNVDTATASSATGIKITSAAAAGGVALAATSSGTDESMTINAKGAGTITLGNVSTGVIAHGRNTTITGNLVITDATSAAFAVGRQGATNPAFAVNASAASSVAGLRLDAGAAGSGVAIVVTSSGSNEPLSINAKGTGVISFGEVSTGNITFYRTLVPQTNDGAALGTTSLGFSDLHLADGGLINWANGKMTIDGNTADAMGFGGAANGYRFDAYVCPTTNDVASLGVSTLCWSDLFLAAGAVINFNSDVLITHSSNLLAFSGASSGYSFDAVVSGTTMSMTGSISAASVAGTMVATAGDQEAASSATVVVTPSVQHRHPSACKVWVDFNTAGGVHSSFNVSSVTDGGTGTWTVNYSTAFSTLEHVVSVNGGYIAGVSVLVYTPTSIAANSCQVQAGRRDNGTSADPDTPARIYFTAYGDQ